MTAKAKMKARMKKRTEARQARVWRKLPEDLIWEVLRFVPAVKHFQWQAVSRKWHQVLTSSYFRIATAAAAAAAAPRESEEEQQQPYVVAGVGDKLWYTEPGEVKVVDIDLCSFVPSSFWKYRTPSYSVVAAANGLVCISNMNVRLDNSDEDDSSNESDSECQDDSKHQPQRTRRPKETQRRIPKETQLCVLNPVTRACKVLPPVPFKPWGWLPPTPTMLTIFGLMPADYSEEVRLATCDLAANGGGGGGGWDLAECRPSEAFFIPAVAVFAGTTYVSGGNRTRVLTPGSLDRFHPDAYGPDSTLAEAACAWVKEPSVAHFGMDAAQGPW